MATQQFQGAMTSGASGATLDSNSAQSQCTRDAMMQIIQDLWIENKSLRMKLEACDCSKRRKTPQEYSAEMIQEANTAIDDFGKENILPDLQARRISVTKFKEDPYMESYKDDTIYSETCYRKTSLIKDQESHCGKTGMKLENGWGKY